MGRVAGNETRLPCADRFEGGGAGFVMISSDNDDACARGDACLRRRHPKPQPRRRLMETVVLQMTRWLSEDEAERVKKAFEEALAA